MRWTAAVGPIADAVSRTVEARSARLVLWSCRGKPTPEAKDLAGEGWVDLRRHRLWLRKRAAPTRAAEQVRGLSTGGPGVRATRRIGARFLSWLSRREREIYLESGTRSKRKRDGSWSEPRPIPEELLPFEDPVWLFGPLSKVQAGTEEPAGQEATGEVETTCWRLELTEREIAAPGWQRLTSFHTKPPASAADSDLVPRDSVPAVVWVDAKGLIRRMSFESERFHGGPLPSSVWAVTELVGFGVSVPEAPGPIEADGRITSDEE
jgi:hypothetical protein